MTLRPEDRLQARCAKYLTAALPPEAWFSGIEHARKQSVMAGQVQKAKGVKRGLPDLNVWWAGRYFGIELKVNTGTSDAQEAFGAAMERNGFNWVVIRSVEALDAYLRSEGFPILASMRIAAMDHDAKLAVPEKTKAKCKPIAARPSPARLRRVAALRRQVMF